MMQELTIEAVDIRSGDALNLIARLDDELTRRYGDVQGQSGAANTLADHATFLVASLDGRPVGCGAFRPMGGMAVEIKRMFVEPDCRGRGLARRLLAELEERARRAGYSLARLETGVRQPEAIRLYESAGYRRIPSYGTYAGNADSACFEKSL
jgi:putative acetyltransferase